MEIHMSTSKLKKNMKIARDVFLNNGVILAPSGTIVDDNVQSLLARHFIDKVYVNLEDTSHMVKNPETPMQESLDEQHKQAFGKTFRVAKEDVASSFDKLIFKSENVNPEELISILNRVIEQSDNEVDLNRMLYAMKESSQDIYTHSISTALIAQQLGKWMRLGEDEIYLVGLAGLLHDIGMMKLPKDLVEKPEAELSMAEERMLQKHVVFGYQLVKDMDRDGRVAKTVLTHHERMDGSGYPLRVTGGNIIKMARLVAIADTYDRMTTMQPGKEALNPFSVAVYFEDDAYGKFDGAMQLIFLQNMLESFVNCDVVLNNGRRGQVAFVNKFNLSSPLIKCGGKVYDLALRKDLHIRQVLR